MTMFKVMSAESRSDRSAIGTRLKTLSNLLYKAGLALSMVFLVAVTPLLLSSGSAFDCLSAEARTKKKSAAPSRSRGGSTKSRAAAENRRSAKRSAKNERRESWRAARGDDRRHSRSSRDSRRESSRPSRHDKHSAHAAHASKSAHRGHHHHHEEEAPKHETVVKPPPPSPEQVEANSRRESSYQTMARAYRLYDEGINARLAGDYGTAVSKLNESYNLFNDARGYQRSGESSLQEALVHYELGQACEGQGNILSARDSYVRCLNIRPTMVEASIRLVSMLATAGQWQLALAKAQDAVRTNPTDPRVHQLMALALGKTGHAEEARAEASKAQQMLRITPKYKPMGIDAVWRRTHKEDGTPITETETGVSEGESTAKPDTGKSDVDNPDDVMGVEENDDEDED